jgi:NitT/TauT family transport system permease protein
MLYGALGLGQLLNEGRDLNDINQVVAIMVLIALLGYIVDGLLFRTLDSSIRHKWGMAAATAS